MTRHLLRQAGWLVLLVCVTVSPVVVAVEPSEILSDPKLEARARSISANLRCLVCQNQSIDDSNADLARDLRLVVRERLTQGDTDEQIYDYVAARYGDFVLLKPPFKLKTVLLWAGPAAVLILGLIGICIYFKRRGTGGEEAVPLTAEEERRLTALLEKEPES